MREPAYSPARIEELVHTFEHPMLAIREGRVISVNGPFAAIIGAPGAALVGRPFTDLVSPEERARLRERERDFTRSAARYPIAIRTEAGLPVPSIIQTQLLPAAQGEPFLVVQVTPLEPPQPTLAFAESLVELATQVVSERTEAGVRGAVLEGLARLGLRGLFLKLSRDRLVPVGEPLEGFALREDFGLEALRDQRPIFGGTGPYADSVYLPVNAGPEVLALVSLQPNEPPHLLGQHASVLTLFSKQISSALGNARFIADFQRRTDELEAIAGIARLAAQPYLVPLEEFLALVAPPLDADAVSLHGVDAAGMLSLLAHRGLEPAMIATFAQLPRTGGLAGHAAAVEGGVSWSDEQQGPLARASGGRYKAAAAVPLVQGEKLLGVLQAFRKDARPYNVDALQLLGTLGDLLVAVLEQRRLQDESARQLKETQLLLDLARTTSGTLEMSSILDVACDFLVKLLDTANCFILLYDPEARVLRGAASSAGHREFFRTVVIGLNDDSVAARTARERRPIAVEDTSRQGGGFARPLANRFGETAVLGLPLTSRDELIGVVVVDDTRGPRQFGQPLVDLAQATVGQLALSIANARLYESLWQSYAELAATRAEMVKRERLAALGELSAIVAHEVRNPLGVIFNAVSSLRRLLKPRGDAEMLLDILREESDRLNRMVGDLLDFARPRELSSHPEDVREVLQESIDAALSQPGLECERIRFDTQIEPGLPPIQLDRRLFRQALVNAAVNAIQAMPRGGTVTVRASREQRDGRELLRVELADQGVGIPPEVAHRIFEPFFTTKAKGTGLGLAVVKRILDDHDGEVAVSSTLGQGTTFTFRLPLSRGGGTTLP